MAGPNAQARATAAVNLATIHLFAGDHDSAAAAAADVPDESQQDVWCWEPGDVLGGQMTLTCMSFAGWTDAVRLALNRLGS